MEVGFDYHNRVYSFFAGLKIDMFDPYFYFDEELDYPVVSPYHPVEIYPEYPFRGGGAGDAEVPISVESNRVYDSIRKLLIELHTDREHENTEDWNPLGPFIHEGQTVLIKPNLVNHRNPAEKDKRRGMDCLITHPSVVRCLFDYVYIALRGKGKIVIADAPIQGCNFEELLESTGYGSLFSFFQSKVTEELQVITADLRETVYRKEDNRAIQINRVNVEFPGCLVNIGDNSWHRSVKEKKRFRVTDYDGADTVHHHSEGRNEYMISRAVLDADVIISISKPKTHRIAGYTAALKNMIGANARKEYLPHHQIGAKENGGDEYTGNHILLKGINSLVNDKRNWAIKHRMHSLERLFNAIGRLSGRKLNKYEPERYRFGMWYGNDTIWRTILDVNRAVYYSDREGHICDSPQRMILNFGDMIVSGDHEGPLSPSYKHVGGILFAENSVVFDLIVVKLMGFNWRCFPVLRAALKDTWLTSGNAAPESIVLRSNDDHFSAKIGDIGHTFFFAPTTGWKGILSVNK